MMNIKYGNNKISYQSGFTLIEVMVVVVILGILAAAIVPNIMKNPDKARVARAKGDITAIEGAASMYKLDNFNYPSTDQGLESLVTKPSGDPEPKHYTKGGYLKKLKKDPWGLDYQYLSPGVHGDIDISSLGPDQVPSDDDIGNWNIE